MWGERALGQCALGERGAKAGQGAQRRGIPERVQMKRSTLY